MGSKKTRTGKEKGKKKRLRKRGILFRKGRTQRNNSVNRLPAKTNGGGALKKPKASKGTICGKDSPRKIREAGFSIIVQGFPKKIQERERVHTEKKAVGGEMAVRLASARKGGFKKKGEEQTATAVKKKKEKKRTLKAQLHPHSEKSEDRKAREDKRGTGKNKKKPRGQEAFKQVSARKSELRKKNWPEKDQIIAHSNAGGVEPKGEKIGQTVQRESSTKVQVRKILSMLISNACSGSEKKAKKSGEEKERDEPKKKNSRVVVFFGFFVGRN